MRNEGFREGIAVTIGYIESHDQNNKVFYISDQSRGRICVDEALVDSYLKPGLGREVQIHRRAGNIIRIVPV